MSDDIHEDGSVELINRWLPGGAQGNKNQTFIDRQDYIFAVRLSSGYWEFEVVIANVDPEHGVEFGTTEGDAWTAWTWDEVEWFIPCDELDLPYIESPVVEHSNDAER